MSSFYSDFRGQTKHGLLKKVCTVLPRTTAGVVAVPQAAVTTVDSNMTSHVRENAVRCASVCSEMDGSRFENLLLLRGTVGVIIWYLATFVGDVCIEN
jgi:hypothetical protein